MPGRHRKQQATSWKLPTGIAAALSAGLVVTFWAVSSPEQPAEPIAYLVAPGPFGVIATTYVSVVSLYSPYGIPPGFTVQVVLDVNAIDSRW